MSALSAYRIVELAEGVAGEYCGKLLADFGAEIVKVEPPGGSATRRLGPFKDGAQGPEASGLFAYLNTNKRSVVLDLESDAGKAALEKLLGSADALIDDHAPGWLAGPGLAPETLREAHPRLVACAITPFGQDAPDDRKHSEDLIVMQASGWGYHTPSEADPEKPPLKGAGRFQVSYESGLEAAMCVAACLHGREETGEGRFIDLSMQEVMAGRVDYVLGQMIAGDMDVGPERTRFDLGGPAKIFPCREGSVYLFMSATAHWEAIKTLLGDPDWAKDYPDNWLERGLTPERIAEARRHIGDWLKTQDKHEAAAKAQELGLTMVPVNNAADLPENEQLSHRGFFAELDHPRLGTTLYPTVPYRFGETPAELKTPAPALGADGADPAGEGA